MGWDAAEGGAVDAGDKKEKPTPRVIPALPDRDWRLEAQQKQLAKAPHQQAQKSNDTKEVEELTIQYGLTIIKKKEPQEGESMEIVEIRNCRNRERQPHRRTTARKESTGCAAKWQNH